MVTGGQAFEPLLQPADLAGGNQCGQVAGQVDRGTPLHRKPRSTSSAHRFLPGAEAVAWRKSATLAVDVRFRIPGPEANFGLFRSNQQ